MQKISVDYRDPCLLWDSDSRVRKFRTPGSDPDSGTKNLDSDSESKTYYVT